MDFTIAVFVGAINPLGSRNGKKYGGMALSGRALTGKPVLGLLEMILADWLIGYEKLILTLGDGIIGKFSRPTRPFSRNLQP